MYVTAIIAAAGSGRRLGSAKPKQMLDIGGGSDAAAQRAGVPGPPADHRVIVVHAGGAVESLALHGGRPATRPGDCASSPAASGGRTRWPTASTRVSPQADVVLIHDAARPFVSAGADRPHHRRRRGARRRDCRAAVARHGQAVARRRRSSRPFRARPSTWRRRRRDSAATCSPPP